MMNSGHFQRFATRFIIATAIENGGRFEDHHIDHLKLLRGWSQKSSVVHLHVKKVLEDYSVSAGLLIPGEECWDIDDIT